MNKDQIDAAFDQSYFKIIKDLNVFNGLWPHKCELEKFFRRIAIFTVLICIAFPHVPGVYIQCRKDVTICGENISGLLYSLECIVKCMIPIISKEKFEKVYLKIAENWLEVTDSKEKSLMDDFAKLARLKTLVYYGYVLIAAFCFSNMIVVPIVLDYILPLNQSREKILVTKAEYPFDPFEYYYELYVFYVIAAIVSVTAHVACDSTYTAITHHGLGLIAIAKYRMKRAANEKSEEVAYKIIISAIEMHKQAIKIFQLVESIYQMVFLTIIIATVIFLICGSVIIAENFDKLFELIRLISFAIAALMHIFFNSWPGQLVINYTEDLFLSIYTNTWYNLSERAKTLLKIMMIRCIKPCFLTAGGFYIMSFENFGTIVKTTLSYMTVAMSFLY